jgi:hypothetical protein
MGLLPRDGHSSRPRITEWLKRPTRRFHAPSRYVFRRTRKFLPIWSCSVWGLPCPSHYCGSGALLPHLFTLTSTFLRTLRRYIFCGTGRRMDLNPSSRTLSGTLLCGVRTFLSPSLTNRERPSGPAAYLSIIGELLRVISTKQVARTGRSKRKYLLTLRQLPRPLQCSRRQ